MTPADEAAIKEQEATKAFMLKCDEVRNRMGQAAQLVGGYASTRKDQYLVSAKALLAGIDADVDKLKVK